MNHSDYQETRYRNFRATFSSAKKFVEATMWQYSNDMINAPKLSFNIGHWYRILDCNEREAVNLIALKYTQLS